jgi:hypothetical protein
VPELLNVTVTVLPAVTIMRLGSKLNSFATVMVNSFEEAPLSLPLQAANSKALSVRRTIMVRFLFFMVQAPLRK